VLWTRIFYLEKKNTQYIPLKHWHPAARIPHCFISQKIMSWRNTQYIPPKHWHSVTRIPHDVMRQKVLSWRETQYVPPTRGHPPTRVHSVKAKKTSVMKMGAISSSETSVTNYKPLQCHNKEDDREQEVVARTYRSLSFHTTRPAQETTSRGGGTQTHRPAWLSHTDGYADRQQDNLISLLLLFFKIRKLG
jgi:hypothetical protein